MLPTDTYVGPYRILRLIRRGGQGSVYLGYDQRLRRKVAIKIRPLPGPRVQRRRILREARMVASIQSAKVVQLYDVIESSDHLALVMEYVPGCDLEELLATTHLSLASVLTIGADIAGALAAARQQHIVHGDLKAGNVLISDSGRVKLTDFGIAQNTGGSDAPPEEGVSLTALSPEQYLGRPLDVRTDLFALGCLLYRMLSAQHPFFRDGQLDIGLLLGGAPSPIPDLVADERDVPENLVKLVSELLQADPQSRPANTHAVRQVLRGLSREIPLAASDSLLQQARPCFRHESPEDIPAHVPAGLGRDARSRMVQGRSGFAWFRGKWTRLGWPGRIATGGSLLVLLGVPLTMALRPAETLVHLPQPRLKVAGDMDLPLDISVRWLVEEAKSAVLTGLGPVRFSGPVGATPARLLAADAGDGAPPEPQESLQLDLRCLEGFCVYAAARERAGIYNHQQAVLFPDMPLSQWRAVVRGTTLRLYQ